MHNPTHPGEALKNGWPEGVTVAGAARRIGVTRAMLSRILNGQAGSVPIWLTGYRTGGESMPRCGCGCKPPTIFGRLNNNLVRALRNSSSPHDLQNRAQTSLGASALRRMAHRDCGRLQKTLPSPCLQEIRLTSSMRSRQRSSA